VKAFTLMSTRSIFLMAILGLAACAGKEPLSPRAQINSEVGCYTSMVIVTCRLNNDLAGGYPITSLDE